MGRKKKEFNIELLRVDPSTNNMLEVEYTPGTCYNPIKRANGECEKCQFKDKAKCDRNLKEEPKRKRGRGRPRKEE